jgi:type III pantothenate kinase
MLLLIDCGNTNIVFAIAQNDRILKKWRINTDPKRTADEYYVWLIKLLEIENINLLSISDCIIASVVPDALFSLINFNKEYLKIEPFIVGENNLKIGIDINIDNPSEAGADRIVNAVAVKKFYNKPSIVIDFGTATTFDIVSKRGNYEGGIIAPGVNLSLEALYMAASRLPRIKVDNTKNINVVGKNTKDSMYSGIYWGYISLIEGLVKRINEEKNFNYYVIATGGLSNLFSKNCSIIEKVDNELTLNGLIHIYNINKN